LYTAQIKIQQQSRYRHRQGIAKMRRFVVFVISASATVSSSQLSLKFTFSPMRVFARLIKHSLNVSVQRPPLSTPMRACILALQRRCLTTFRSAPHAVRLEDERLVKRSTAITPSAAASVASVSMKRTLG